MCEGDLKEHVLGFACLCFKKILRRMERKLNSCEMLGGTGWMGVDMSGRFVTVTFFYF